MKTRWCVAAALGTSLLLLVVAPGAQATGMSRARAQNAATHAAKNASISGGVRVSTAVATCRGPHRGVVGCSVSVTLTDGQQCSDTTVSVRLRHGRLSVGGLTLTCSAPPTTPDTSQPTTVPASTPSGATATQPQNTSTAAAPTAARPTDPSAVNPTSTTPAETSPQQQQQVRAQIDATVITGGVPPGGPVTIVNVDQMERIPRSCDPPTLEARNFYFRGCYYGVQNAGVLNSLDVQYQYWASNATWVDWYAIRCALGAATTTCWYIPNFV